MSGKDLDDILVQPIIISDDLSHEDAIWFGAAASIAFKYMGEGSLIDEWLASGMRKTVRRAKKSKIKKLVDENHQFINSYLATASAPLRYEDFCKEVKRMQVSGTDLERIEDYDPVPVDKNIFVLDTLTTGKAVAQAAHALWMSDVDVMSEDFEVMCVSAEELAALAAAEGVVSVVRDAGHTEVDADTLTAVMVVERTRR